MKIYSSLELSWQISQLKRWKRTRLVLIISEHQISPKKYKRVNKTTLGRGKMRRTSEQSNGIWFWIATRSKPVNVGRTIQSALVVDSEATLRIIFQKLRLVTTLFKVWFLYKKFQPYHFFILVVCVHTYHIMVWKLNVKHRLLSPPFIISIPSGEKALVDKQIWPILLYIRGKSILWDLSMYQLVGLNWF